ncbi:heavy metal translocating P-type ATPase [Eubacterium sp. AF15-50]|uniref:heavy metal translocating P-type ATPase n=1 Tax=unclassified Eubacterium (in: firmicutes) TaxID=2624479 RepID=UPI0026D24048
MNLYDKIINRKNERSYEGGSAGHSHDDHCSCGHDHEHEHHHDHNHCSCGHDHDHHGHSHGCDCCEDGAEIDLRKTVAGVVVFLIAMVIFHIPGLFKTIDIDMAQLITYLLIYLLTARDIVLNAIKNLFKGKAMDEQFLMTVSSLGAFFVGQYPEACAVMLFYMVGELFQDYAVDKSRDSITDLMDIRPDYANLLKKDGSYEKVSPDKVKIGDTIIVKPGEKVPLDGVVTSGQGSIDTSSLTGESLPRETMAGDDIISGSISINGALTIKVTKEFGESTVSKILELVEHASGKKAKTERFITRFAKVYTPIVVACAVVLAIIPPLVVSFVLGGNIADFAKTWQPWIYRALTFLVVSCPCALVISVPLSFFAGIGAASTKGVLVKGSDYLEKISGCDTIVFDKTGTLTKGIFKVSKINSKVSDLEFLKAAVIAEIYSNHPIAKSLKDALKITDSKAYFDIEARQNEISIEEIHGKGIKAQLDGSTILAGNKKLMDQFGIACDNAQGAATVVYVTVDGQYLGYALIEDQIKETSKETIKKLKELGVKKTVMLTGDRKEIADSIAKELGIDEVHSELLPADKVSHVEKLLKESKTLAFVGDGVNDAPVLARADVGIAMGAMGSDAAIEAADIVLMDDNPKNITKAIKISRRTLSIAKQNIIFALVVKVAVLVLAAVGIATMWAAVFADVGVCVLAILNAMRTAK